MAWIIAILYLSLAGLVVLMRFLQRNEFTRQPTGMATWKQMSIEDRIHFIANHALDGDRVSVLADEPDAVFFAGRLRKLYPQLDTNIVEGPNPQRARITITRPCRKNEEV